mmetsp:Transcript_26384/g.64283  ORF Transcript_26384/g.64283 Transcript_26384/m.64283 type:complete len:164 (-) Transcript_26384:441-932(-)
MKHQRTPIMIEDSSDDESLSQGPLRKRPKRMGTNPALTLESLIRAGEALSEEDQGSESIKETPNTLGRVTPTKELQDNEEAEAEAEAVPPLNRKLVQRALSHTLAALEEESKPTPAPPARIPESSSGSNKDWRKYCRPLAAPPRLPNVPFGLSVSEQKRAIFI